MSKRRADRQPARRYRIALLSALISVLGTALVGAFGSGTAPASTTAPAPAICAADPGQPGCTLDSVDASPTCGQAGLPGCASVKGALLVVTAEVLTGNADDTGPLRGAVVDIIQAGTASGAQTTGQPCYPTGNSDDQTCGPVPSADPVTASTVTCTTDDTGSCNLTAMWDGTAEAFPGPDLVTLEAPAGYAVANVTGCSAMSGNSADPVCDLTPPDWSQPLSIAFDLAPDPVITVELAGPPEPCQPETTCEPGAGQIYDDDAVDQATATVTPAGGGAPLACQVAGGVAGAGDSAQVAACSVTVPPGAYSVSVPPTVSTPESEVQIPLAYVVGAGSQTVTATAGSLSVADFSTAYEPTLTVVAAGPAEPCDPLYCVSGSDTIFDNDAIDGAAVAITPTGVSAGGAASCSLANGEAGDSGYGQDAYCTVNVPPGTYSVSLPADIDTQSTSEVGVPLAYVNGPNPQSVTLVAGAWSDVNFSTAYEPTITVQIAGPLEPPCTPNTCTTNALVYDNDAVNGATVTITPAAGTAGEVQTCLVGEGYPGDNTDYGQDASCSVSVPPGTYSVSVPATINTPDSEVGIPVAYVSGSLSQSVTVAAGDAPDVSFATAYSPTIDVTLAGPLEPGCTASASCAAGAVYDNDSVDGTTVTVTPVDGTTGSPQVCQVAGGEPGGTGDGQQASCLVGVSPGTYTVSVPKRIAPDPDYGWGYIDVSEVSQQTTVGAGDNDSVNFTTSYQTMENVGSGTGSARTSDGLLTATGSGGTGTVTVGEYSSDPEGPASFNTASAANDYFDVAVSPTSTFTKVVLTVCGLRRYSDDMGWWSPGTGAELGTVTVAAAEGAGQWEPVSPASSLTSRQAGCLTAVLTESTVPGTGQLSGTVFAVPVSLPAQQVSFASANPSPVAVGSKYDPVARSSAGLAVKLVVSAASTKGTCSIAAGGVVAFTGVGMCVVEAEQDGSASWAAAVASQSIVVSRGRPVAVKASYAVDYRHALAVTVRDGILAKDTLNGAVLVSHTRPAHGALSLRANGAFTYVPRPSFSGTDGFTYTVKNSLGRATASVTIHVGPPPAPGTGGRR